MSGVNCSLVVLRAGEEVSLRAVNEENGALDPWAVIASNSSGMSASVDVNVLVVHHGNNLEAIKITTSPEEKVAFTEHYIEHLPSEGAAASLKWSTVSPKGKYIVAAYQIGQIGTELCIWDTSDFKLVEKHTSASSIQPENCVWRDDDRVFGVFLKDKIRFGCPGESEGLIDLAAPSNSVSIHIAPSRCNEDYLIGFVFKPCNEDSSVGKLTVVKIRIQPLDTPPALNPTPSTSLRPTEIQEYSFDCVDGIDCLFSQSGKYVLYVASAQVDALGQNYGSVGDVWLMALDSLNCPMRKLNKNLVQDAAWSPTCDELVVIEGKSPSDCTLYRLLDSAPIAETQNVFRIESTPLHRGYKNTVRWSPHGDMIAVGGFGNLAGDIALYYKDDCVTYSLIAERRVPCTVKCAWSPCGRYLMTASLWPRMRVDNQVTMWSRNFTMVAELAAEMLTDALWIDSSAKNTPCPAAILPRPEKVELVDNATSSFKVKGHASYSSTLLQLYMSGKMRLEELPVPLQNKIKSNKFSRAAKAKSTSIQPIDSADWRSNAAAVPVGVSPAPKGRVKKTAAAKSKAESPTQPTSANDSLSEDTKRTDFPPPPQPLTAPQVQAQPQAPPAPVNPPLPILPPAVAPSSVYPRPLPAMMFDFPPLRCYDSVAAPPPPQMPPPPPPPPPPRVGPTDENIVSLLQQILPSTSTVHVEAPLKMGEVNTFASRYAPNLMMQPPPPPPPSLSAVTHISAPPAPPQPASPSCKWLYKDPRGEIQGPFSRRQMRAWWEKGFFPHNLRVKLENERDFRPLSLYYPDPQLAFNF